MSTTKKKKSSKASNDNDKSSKSNASIKNNTKLNDTRKPAQSDTTRLTTSSVNDVLTKSGIPKDAKIIALLLKSMGVEEFDPHVIHQLLEFMHRYTSNVFQDAVLYSNHANKKKLDLEDIRLATQSRVNYSLTQPPPRELLLELAEKKNAKPLPIIPNKVGVLLPPEEYCLTATNYQVDSKGDCGGASRSAMLVKSASSLPTKRGANGAPSSASSSTTSTVGQMPSSNTASTNTIDQNNNQNSTQSVGANKSIKFKIGKPK